MEVLVLGEKSKSRGFIIVPETTYIGGPVCMLGGWSVGGLSLLTNSALVIRVQKRGEGGVGGSWPMSTAMHITWHGAQINLGDLPPYLTYGGGVCYNPSLPHNYAAIPKVILKKTTSNLCPCYAVVHVYNHIVFYYFIAGVTRRYNDWYRGSIELVQHFRL